MPVARLPSAEIAAPPTRTARAPSTLVIMPEGRFRKTRARAKALTAKPTMAADMPRLLTSRGRVGITMPCPIVINMVATARRRTRGSWRAGWIRA